MFSTCLFIIHCSMNFWSPLNVRTNTHTFVRSGSEMRSAPEQRNNECWGWKRKSPQMECLQVVSLSHTQTNTNTYTNERERERGSWGKKTKRAKFSWNEITRWWYNETNIWILLLVSRLEIIYGQGLECRHEIHAMSGARCASGCTSTYKEWFLARLPPACRPLPIHRHSHTHSPKSVASKMRAQMNNNMCIYADPTFRVALRKCYGKNSSGFVYSTISSTWLRGTCWAILWYFDWVYQVKRTSNTGNDFLHGKSLVGCDARTQTLHFPRWLVYVSMSFDLYNECFWMIRKGKPLCDCVSNVSRVFTFLRTFNQEPCTFRYNNPYTDIEHNVKPDYTSAEWQPNWLFLIYKILLNHQYFAISFSKTTSEVCFHVVSLILEIRIWKCFGIIRFVFALCHKVSSCNPWK